MACKLIVRLSVLTGVAGPLFLFQQGCTLDPDITLQAFLLAFNETLTFALNNAVVAFR